MNEDQEAVTIKTAVSYSKAGFQSSRLYPIRFAHLLRAQERYRNDATFHRFVRGLVTMLTTEGYDQEDLIAACALAAMIQKDEAHE